MQDKVIITAVVSISLWVATQVFQLLRDLNRRRIEKNNLVRALYAEIDFNTKDLYIFAENSATLKDLEQKLREDTKLVPHITDAHHTLIYKSNITNLHYISDTIITHLVLYYGLLEKIKEQIDGLNQNSFQTVSANGRYITIKRILDNVKECEGVGDNILLLFTKSYRKLNLTRQHRKLLDSRQRQK